MEPRVVINESQETYCTDLMRLLLLGSCDKSTGLRNCCNKALRSLGGQVTGRIREQVAQMGLTAPKRRRLLALADELDELCEPEESAGKCLPAALVCCLADGGKELHGSALALLRQFPGQAIADRLIKEAFGSQSKVQRCVRLLQAAARFPAPSLLVRLLVPLLIKSRRPAIAAAAIELLFAMGPLQPYAETMKQAAERGELVMP